jgi:putative tryptophan/tyrosine transport system substrate-binding protein
MRRRSFLAALAASPAVARAQPALRDVGFIHPGGADSMQPRLAAFADGLSRRGFVEGRNVTVIARAADYDKARIAAYVDELVRRDVAAILAVGPQVVQQTRAATSTIPIVGLDLESDPVKSGFVQSLSHPGGNLTGLFFDFPEFSGKWLEILGEIIPGLERVGVLWDPGTGSVQLDALVDVATRRGVRLQVLKVEKPDQIDGAFAAAKSQSQAVLALSSPVFGSLTPQVAEAALRHHMPSIMLFPEYGAAGGLIAYGTDLFDLFRQAGEIVGKVLGGAKPADLPVERPSRFRLVVNLRTAKTLGLVIPPVVLLRADEVIE